LNGIDSNENSTQQPENSSSAESDNTESSNSNTSESINGDISETQQPKTLVAYFAYSENMGDTSDMSLDAIASASLNASTSNTEGNLQIMAQEIQSQKGADVFHIIIYSIGMSAASE